MALCLSVLGGTMAISAPRTALVRSGLDNRLIRVLEQRFTPAPIADWSHVSGLIVGPPRCRLRCTSRTTANGNVIGLIVAPLMCRLRCTSRTTANRNAPEPPEEAEEHADDVALYVSHDCE